MRLVHGEADLLPGLVVDRYGPVSVVQCLTLGMARVADWVREALERLFPGDPMLRLDDPTAARIEGFEPVRETYPTELVVEEGPARFAVALGSGHKTGLYLDQQVNYRLVAELAKDLLAHFQKGTKLFAAAYGIPRPVHYCICQISNRESLDTILRATGKGVHLFC